jgi:hypothetical protein
MAVARAANGLEVTKSPVFRRSTAITLKVISPNGGPYLNSVEMTSTLSLAVGGLFTDLIVRGESCLVVSSTSKWSTQLYPTTEVQAEVIP